MQGKKEKGTHQDIEGEHMETPYRRHSSENMWPQPTPKIKKNKNTELHVLHKRPIINFYENRGVIGKRNRWSHQVKLRGNDGRTVEMCL